MRLAGIDVLIVGAGPTGLTLAMDLHRRGVSVRIVDQSAGPQPGSRGFSLKPRTLDVFDDLGVAADIVAAGRVPTRTRVHLGGTLLTDFSIAQEPPSPSKRYPDSVALPQWQTEGLLRDALSDRGLDVEFDTRLTGFDADRGGVTAELHGRTGTEWVRAGYLVGCDGGHSTVRGQLGLSFAGTTNEEQRALLADVDVEGPLDTDTTYIWLSPGMFVLRPSSPPGRWQAVASLEPDGTGNVTEPSPELLRELALARTRLPGLRLGDAHWLSVWRYSLRMVDRYRVGRVFLAGDAAHVHTPFGAFGMNTGVQDAYNLGWKLGLVLAGRANETLLDSYQAERLPVARAVLAESDRAFSAATAPPRLLRPLIRSLVRPYLVRLNKRGRNDHPDYRTGPLTRQVPSGRGRIRAGDSAPDGIGLIGPDARRLRLTDLYRGTHFTLLAFGGPHPDLVTPQTNPVLRTYQIVPDGKPCAHRVVDADGNIRRAYHARNGTLALVRPDGYLGLLSHPGDGRLLREYFDALGLAGTETMCPIGNRPIHST